MDRAQLIAMLPDGAAKVLGVIERVAGDRAVARVSFLDFQFEHRLGRLTISRAIGLLQDTGLIDVEIGPQRANLYRLSRRWAAIDEDAARTALAKMKTSAQLTADAGSQLRPGDHSSSCHCVIRSDAMTITPDRDVSRLTLSAILFQVIDLLRRSLPASWRYEMSRVDHGPVCVE